MNRTADYPMWVVGTVAMIGKRRAAVQAAQRRRIALWVVLALLVLGLVGVQWMKARNVAQTEQYLTKFTPVPELGMFEESRPRAYGGTARLPHAVLLLHGYSASPQEFDTLVKHLEAEGIPYYAPQITGFGLSDLRLIHAAKPEDWLRDAINSFDLLAAMAEEVSIVGHSNGGALAVYVAEHRQVKHLVLSGPNLLPDPGDKLYKDLLNTPVLSQVLRGVMPVFVKPTREGRVTNTDTLDPESALGVFHYPALPIGSLKTLWEIQDRADITKAQFESLTLVYGEHDSSVDMVALSRLLKESGIEFAAHPFADSAHNVLEDYDRESASAAVVEALKR